MRLNIWRIEGRRRSAATVRSEVKISEDVELCNVRPHKTLPTCGQEYTHTHTHSLYSFSPLTLLPALSIICSVLSLDFFSCFLPLAFFSLLCFLFCLFSVFFSLVLISTTSLTLSIHHYTEISQQLCDVVYR